MLKIKNLESEKMDIQYLKTRENKKPVRAEIPVKKTVATILSPVGRI
jgi:hypothetical protein